MGTKNDKEVLEWLEKERHKSEGELLSWLEEERRKYSLAFSANYQRYLVRSWPRIMKLLPILLVGFLIILLFQQHRISELEDNNTLMQQEVTALHGQTDWYKSLYEQAQGAPYRGAAQNKSKQRNADPFMLDYWGAP